MALLTSKTQNGAALIFSLLMLMLLTLTTVSMIQQNKNQLAITTNMGIQTQAFAQAETALSLFQTEIERTRQPNKDNPNTPVEDRYDCSSTDHFFDGDTISLTNMPTATATITGVSCIVNSLEYRCTGGAYTPLSNSTAAATACQKLTNAQCPTEMYTLDVTFTDSDSSAKRTVRSKYSVGCSVLAS